MFNLVLSKDTLSFHCQYSSKDSSFTIINATEKIVCPPIKVKGDSIFFSTPVFQNIFCLKAGPGYLRGEWRNLSRGNNYRIPVFAYMSIDKPSTLLLPSVTGIKWECDFGTANERYKAIGIFNEFTPVGQDPLKNTNYTVTGTFLTETGDYRYLEGKVVNNKLTLSCFDGSHAFLFKGTIKGDSITNGAFYSGTHSYETWTAWRNDKAQLRNPDSLTTLKPGQKTVAFSFKDLKGNVVTYPSKRFENKPVIISVMGSWCPNCMDETLFMQELKNKYESKGLEILALCFERTDDYTRSVEAVNKMKENLNLDFDFLIAGTPAGESTSKALPSITKIWSYPTTLYLDKKGNVRKIYTGFYGPSTGLYYNHYTEQTIKFVEALLME
ncbi:MAG TPA: TlpA disulfide reductase family protein [Flavobacteriales bacterium]|nr:TlpA disulfide reductase family protein [Flavobacteriales bacterium]